MSVIGPEHLEKLLESDDPDATLVIIGGRAAVVSAESARSGEHADALLVTSREALIAEFEVVNKEQLDQLAQRLDVAVSDLGA
ncbi:MAG: hypothetical protein GEV11_27345 [Streptosporangiales bacterium]|nr:hypothetical protein [Streptosporangiales bacterium]